jgi:hypothetical protein
VDVVVRVLNLEPIVSDLLLFFPSIASAARSMNMGDEKKLQEQYEPPERSLSTSTEMIKKELAQEIFVAKMDIEKTKSVRKRRHLQENMPPILLGHPPV